MTNKIPLEKAIVNTIMFWLKSEGYFCWKEHGSAYSTTGIPDIIVISKTGRFVGLECKRPKIGKVTTLQQRTCEAINKAGGYACVVRNLDDAMRAMVSAESGDVGRVDL